MSLNKHMRADRTKWIVVFALLIVLGVGMIVNMVKINQTITTDSVSSFSYSIGLLGTDDGEYDQGTTAIYTKNAITVDGLKCTLAKDATIKYQLYFFDEDGKFLEASSPLEKDFDASIDTVPTSAATVKVMITPQNDPEVSFFEVSTYAGMLTVTYNK